MSLTCYAVMKREQALRKAAEKVLRRWKVMGGDLIPNQREMAPLMKELEEALKK